jgi:hypothetical protein
MKNNKHLRYISLGMITAFLIGLLTTLLVQASIWTPHLIEIASVTWNHSPPL